jgi:tetratricopeptide (TPR) repeat protein
MFLIKNRIGQSFVWSVTNKVSLLFMLIMLNHISCLGLIRPNLYANPEIVDSLERDNLFLLIDGSFFTDTDTSMFSSKWKAYQKKKEESDLNYFALYCVRNSFSDDADRVWQELFTKNKNSIYLLNLIRLKYLIEDYEGLRIYLRNYISKSLNEKDKLTQISTLLKQYNRLEENTIYLGVLSEYSVFESAANLELGEYFLKSGDLASAKNYYEKILNSYSFDIKALDSLMKIAILEENYQNATVYGKVLRKEKYQNLDYFINLSKAYYEIEEYSELISFIEEIPDVYKKDKQILTYWRNSLLSIDPFKSTTVLKKFLIKSNKENRAIDLEFSISEDGSGIYKRIFHGY